ncbi:hypothetical protein Trydic_g9934, partial [Trypoxylus dichotomus]
KTEKELQDNIILWKEHPKEHVMELNINKTKIMDITKNHQRLNVQVDAIGIEEVDQFNYLGVLIEEHGSEDSKSKKHPECIMPKMSIYNAIFRPILAYRYEAWTLTRKLKSKPLKWNILDVHRE